jgi:hypothetical protein
MERFWNDFGTILNPESPVNTAKIPNRSKKHEKCIRGVSTKHHR